MERLLKSRFFIIMLVIYVTYNSGFMLGTTNRIGIILDLVFALVFSAKVLKIISTSKLKLIHYCLIGTIIFTLVTFTIYGFNPVGAYLGIIFKSIVAVGIVHTYKFKEMVIFFKKYLSLIAVVSLVGHFLVIPGVIPLNLDLVYNINDVPYNNLFPFFSLAWTPERNIGIFWEPGIFATFLIIGLIFEISFNEGRRINFIRVILYVITIFTTKSSAGYALLLLIVLLFFMESSNQKNRKMKILMNLLFVIPIVILVMFYPLFLSLLNLDTHEVFSKLMPEMLVNQSRILAIQHNFKVFWKMPIFGVGFSQAGELVKYVSDTSTSTFLLSVFGVPGALYTVLWVYVILKSNLYRKNISLILILIILLIINKEPHYIILFTWILLYYLIYNVSYSSSKNRTGVVFNE